MLACGDRHLPDDGWQAADAAFVKWLVEHQKETGVVTAVSTLVEQISGNPAAKLTAQEIMERLQ